MTTIPTVAPATTAILAALTGTGLLTGDGRKPVGAGWQGAAGNSEFVTYLVLYSLNHLRDGPDASIANLHTDPQLHYQVTGVGVDRIAAETASDIAAQALLGAPLTISGRAVALLTTEASIGVSLDETVNPPLFLSVDRYRLDTVNP